MTWPKFEKKIKFGVGLVLEAQAHPPNFKPLPASLNSNTNNIINYVKVCHTSLELLEHLQTPYLQEQHQVVLTLPELVTSSNFVAGSNSSETRDGRNWHLQGDKKTVITKS